MTVLESHNIDSLRIYQILKKQLSSLKLFSPANFETFSNNIVFKLLSDVVLEIYLYNLFVQIYLYNNEITLFNISYKN